MRKKVTLPGCAPPAEADDEALRVVVTHVYIPAGSTIGYGEGVTADGKTVRFAGDQRPLRDLGAAVGAGEAPEVELAPWQVLP